jgi:uncharacterized DUF497 family protein
LQYNFKWDPQKAQANIRKHKISFERATTVFLDSRALTIYDEMHSENEDRWITLGIDNTGSLIIVCHTFEEESKGIFRVRIFSTRKATKKERQQYKG